MSNSTVYLVTGANRGIGKGFVEKYASPRDSIVIAAVTDISATSNLDRENVIIVKIASDSETDAKEALEVLKCKHGIDHIDVVIANAGICDAYDPVETVDPKNLRRHWEVNTLGPLILFQATIPLLNKSRNPKFVVLSSGAGLFSSPMLPMPTTGYGASKAGVNFIVRQIHNEHPNLIAFPITPGWVDTDLGQTGLRMSGPMPTSPITVRQSVDGMANVIENATREKESGVCWSYDGKSRAW